uniref:Uncharacterized protein n=1 Tax=Arundo donax TaxID=35708 RepID=A0A0A9C8V5_ARUDO
MLWKKDSAGMKENEILETSSDSEPDTEVKTKQRKVVCKKQVG